MEWVIDARDSSPARFVSKNSSLIAYRHVTLYPIRQLLYIPGPGLPIFFFFILSRCIFRASSFIMPTLTRRSPVDSGSFTPLTSRMSTSYSRTARPTTTATSVAFQDIVCAISESRGVSSTVGLAFLNLSTAEAVLSQICDSQTYAKSIQKIAVFEPTEILFMSTAKDSKLYRIIKENIQNTTFTFEDRRYWCDRTGYEYVDELAFPGDAESIKITLGGNYFAACCFAAVCLLNSMVKLG